ncbi:MAG: glycine zipper family protein [Nevskia sp.]|nr:glycine zipper family protein [Nevskia sp.]
MNRPLLICCSLAAAGLLSACVEMPYEPTVAVMPAPYKPFEVFQAEDQMCRGYAQQQIGGQQAGAAANNDTATGAVAGAAIGAASGAAIGQSGAAAGVGAGIGLLAGAAVGNDYGNRSAGYLQYRYNLTYQQCMYSKGNQVPNFAPPASMSPPPRYQQQPRAPG